MLIQAFPCIQTGVVDLIIMDYKPLLNRFSSLPLLKSLKLLSPATAMWVWTRFPSIEFQQACSQAGVDYCIDKSLVGCDEVVKRIRDLSLVEELNKKLNGGGRLSAGGGSV